MFRWKLWAGGVPWWGAPRLARLPELEERRVRRAVVERDGERAALTGPGAVGLPDVVVLVAASVVVDAVAGGINGLAHVNRRDVAAGVRGRRRGVGGEDVQPLATAETELDRDGAPRVDRVHRRRVRDRREEGRGGVEDCHGARGRGGGTRSVRGRRRHRRRADGEDGAGDRAN